MKFLQYLVCTEVAHLANWKFRKAGINLGQVSNYNKFNKKGNKENNDIMQMHDQLSFK